LIAKDSGGAMVYDLCIFAISEVFFQLWLICIASLQRCPLLKCAFGPILWSSQRSKQMRSVAKTSRNFFSQAFEVFGAAVAASAAVRAHRQPSSTDLNTLGIDAKAFNKVQF
jgi:hypothetical protein